MNPYKRLLSLLPQRPLQVGTAAVVSGNSVIVTLPGGGQIKARGDAAVGARVFIRDGVIEGAAPSLPYYEVEV